MAQRVHHAVQRTANNLAVAGMVATVPGFLAGARDVYNVGKAVMTVGRYIAPLLM